MFLVPAFVGKAEVPLATVDFYATSPDEREKLSQNTLLINTQLSDLTAAGWELASTAVVPTSGNIYRQAITRYLFRKAKN